MVSKHWQAETSSRAKKEVARRERERLRLQEKQRRENLERVRQQQNDAAAQGDVGTFSQCILYNDYIGGWTGVILNLNVGRCHNI